jgi:hypothetical protein
MRQLRVKSTSCHVHNEVISECEYDYSLSNEENQSYQPGWVNETAVTYSSSISEAFQYQSSKELDTYVVVGDYGSYGGDGYVYEFLGRLSDLHSNLSQLHQLGWIDTQTRAVIIQFTLYNPNVQLFTSLTLLAEFLSTGGVHPTSSFEPMNFYGNLFSLIESNKMYLFSIYITNSIDFYDSLYADDNIFNVDRNTIIN